METTDSILGRRSIRRDFVGHDVPSEVIELIVRCGTAAPSSKDAQPWRIHVVTSRTLMSGFANRMLSNPDLPEYSPIDPVTGDVREAYAASVRASAEMLRNVPLGLFIESDGSFSGGRSTLAAHPATLPASLVGYSFELLGLGAAIQNMWLAAHDLGLAGTFMGDVLIAEREIRRSLAMSGDLVGALALGYSSGRPHADKIVKAGRVKFHA